MNNAVTSGAVTVESRDTDDRLVVISKIASWERRLDIYQIAVFRNCPHLAART